MTTHASTRLPNEERPVDPAAAARVAEILGDLDQDNQPGTQPAPVPPKPARKPRADKGKPRTQKPAAAPVSDDAAKKKHLALVERVHQKRMKVIAVKDEYDQAVAELQAYMDTL